MDGSTLCFKRRRPIPRVPWEGADAFARTHRVVRSPVVLQGALEGLPAGRWDEEAVVKLIGDHAVTAYVAEAGQTTLGEPTNRKHRAFTFEEFVRRSSSSDAGEGGERFYLTQCRDIAATFPPLAGHLANMPAPGELSETNIFAGSKGISVGTHQDPGVHAFLVHPIGTKRAVLFAPEDAPYLYPFSLLGFDAVHSRVRDIDAPDLTVFPLFPEASAWVTLLEPGEVLYIPPFWWHNLRTLSWSLSISLFSPDPEFVAGSHLTYAMRTMRALKRDLDGMSDYYASFCAARLAAELLATIATRSQGKG